MKYFLAVLIFAFAAVDAGAERGSYTGQFSDSRLSKVTAQAEPENRVAMIKWNHKKSDVSDSHYLTGTVFNDSYGGVFDVAITFFWKNATGTEIGTDRAVLVYGQPANARGSYQQINRNYMAPLTKAYFVALLDIPPGAVIENSSYTTDWTWTLQAYINTDVVLQGNLSFGDLEFGQRSVTGTVKNGLAETLEYAEVFTIFLLDDGTVDNIRWSYIASPGTSYMLGNSQRQFETSYRPLFSDGNQNITTITGVWFEYLNEERFYTNSAGNKAYYTPPATGGDTTELQNDLRRARLGDLNLDGTVDFADFLLFTANFGKSSDYF